jgi:peptidoglycan-associated lipoprotein
MNRVFVATAALSTALVLGLSACQQTTPPPPPPPDTSEFDQGVVIEEEVIEEVVVEIDLGTIYFDFDKSNIREDARGVLRGNAEALIATGADVIIGGNTDDRGDAEYNLALGERRANSVKKYLVNLGVPAGQMRTISYGESKPAALGNNEEAWQWNRRADFQLR